MLATLTEKQKCLKRMRPCDASVNSLQRDQPPLSCTSERTHPATHHSMFAIDICINFRTAFFNANGALIRDRCVAGRVCVC